MLIPRCKAPDPAVETLGHGRLDPASEASGLIGALDFAIAKNDPARRAYFIAM